MQFEEYLLNAKKNEQMGHIQEAIFFYESCISLNPDHKESILSLSRLYLISGKPIQSIELLMKSKNYSQDKDYLVQLSNSYMTLNQFDEAERVLKQALAIKPESAVLNNLGVVAIRRNKGEEAIDYFTESLRLDERNSNTWFNLATYYESQSDPKKAKEVLEQAIKKIDQKELKEKYIQLLNQLGEPSKALELIEEELSRDSEILLFQVAKMRTLFHSKRYDDCLIWIEQMEEKKDIPQNLSLELMEIKEKCYFFNQDLGKSLEILDQLLQQSNGNTLYEFRKAYILAVSRNFKDSLLLLKQILGKRGIPAAIQQDVLSLMKSIEIENWKSLVSYLFDETEAKEMLAQNFTYLLETRGILLPEEGIHFLQNCVDRFKKKRKGFDGSSDFLS